MSVSEVRYLPKRVYMSCNLFAASKKRGIEPAVNDAIDTLQTAVKPVSHVVRKGQTLSQIADLYGTDYQSIAQANNIGNPNNIYVGQRLNIPDAKQMPIPPKKLKPKPTTKKTIPDETKIDSKGVGCGCKPVDKITKEMLKVACSTLSDEYIRKALPIFNKYAKAYKVNNSCRIAHFLAQVGHESCFKVREENLHFTLKRAKQIWSKSRHPKFWTNPNFFSVKGSKYMNPQKYANYVYRNRMDNGDESSGDGYRYRGRGIIQLTGKSNYRKFMNAHNTLFPNNKKNFLLNPGLITNNLEYGIESGFYFWDKIAKANTLADKGDAAVKSITKRVNGGYNGLEDRKSKYKKIYKLMDK